MARSRTTLPLRRTWPARTAWAVFAVCTAVLVHIAVRRPAGPDGMSDLGVYTGAVRAPLDGGSLYGFAAANGDRFVYPPFAGLLLVPVAVLPDLVARVVWTLLSCAQVVVLAWVVVRRSRLPALARLAPGVRVPLVATVLLLTYPVFSGIFLGQVSLLVTLLALVDAVDLAPRRFAGVATGLAAALKLTPLVFVPYLWFTGRRRAAGTALVTWAAAAAVGWWLAPADSRRFVASLGEDRPFQDLGQGDNASLVGLLTRSGLGTGSGPVLVALLVVVALVMVLGYRRARFAHRRGEVLAGAVVVGAVAVLVSPVSWSHHQVPLVLAAACGPALGRVGAATWTAAVLLLTGIPVQALLLHVGAPGPLLRESSVLLALAVACVVPFGATRTARASSSVALLHRRGDPDAAGP
ncbi:hypothetical protein GCM10022197_39260 [Microlunatus spumicola]|uniref:Alpha-1,2-mannosyltransferase n=1 Tax=Microlunatus spumicola TaxID=81499 RepID=A0ABP6Y6E7_9ACTN